MYKERDELIGKKNIRNHETLKLAYKSPRERVDIKVEGSKIKFPNFSPDFITSFLIKAN